MLKDESWKPSNVVGTILIFLGIMPFLLWVLDYLDIIRPNADPAHWPLALFAFLTLGLGVGLRTGQGSSIYEAILSWFKKGA